MSLQSTGSTKLDIGFGDMSISSGGGFGSNSSLGPSLDPDSFSSKAKGYLFQAFSNLQVQAGNEINLTFFLLVIAF